MARRKICTTYRVRHTFVQIWKILGMLARGVKKNEKKDAPEDHLTRFTKSNKVE